MALPHALKMLRRRMDQVARTAAGWREHMDENADTDAILRCADNILPVHKGERLISTIFGKILQSHVAGLWGPPLPGAAWGGSTRAHAREAFAARA